MRLVPRSLFGRLVLILLTGLLLAQLIGALVLFRDRGVSLYQASGIQTALRMAEIVRLLEAAGPDERERLVAVLNTRNLRVSLNDPVWSLPVREEDGSGLAEVFRGILRHNLGDQRRFRVAVFGSESPLPEGGYGMDHGHARMPMGNTGHMGRFGLPPTADIAFLAQVELRDGGRVTFEQRIPREVFAGSARLLFTLALLLVAVVLVALLAVRWVTRPLSLLAGAAHELGRDIQRPPLPERGPGEVREAARAFNTMQARIRRYVEDRTRILTAMSHDLKTPITRLRLRAEMLDDPELRDSFVHDLEEMQAMTAATLDSLRGLDSGEAVQPIDVRALLESIASDAEQAGGSVDVTGMAQAPYPGQPLALKRCITNLVDNALAYGNVAHISLQDQPDQLSIIVSDEGPGIPEEELARVFEPFYRLELSRSRVTGGTGLGLGIARNVARAHGGDLVLRNRDGGGVEALLTLAR